MIEDIQRVGSVDSQRSKNDELATCNITDMRQNSRHMNQRA